MMLQQIMFRQRLSSPYWTHYERRRNTMNESGWFLQQLQVIFLQQWHEVLQHKLAECDHCNIQVVHSCSQLSSRYGAAIPTRRYAACRCILSPSSAVDIFVCPGSSGYETNYDRRPCFRRRGTSSMEQSSSVRHRLLVSWHLQKTSQDLFVFIVILEHRTAHYWLCKAPS